MKEARKALETSSLGRKPRFRLSQLIQSVLMTRTTTDVREMSTALQGREGEKMMELEKEMSSIKRGNRKKGRKEEGEERTERKYLY